MSFSSTSTLDSVVPFYGEQTEQYEVTCWCPAGDCGKVWCAQKRLGCGATWPIHYQPRYSPISAACRPKLPLPAFQPAHLQRQPRRAKQCACLSLACTLPLLMPTTLFSFPLGQEVVQRGYKGTDAWSAQSCCVTVQMVPLTATPARPCCQLGKQVIRALPVNLVNGACVTSGPCLQTASSSTSPSTIWALGGERCSASGFPFRVCVPATVTRVPLKRRMTQ